MIRDASSMDRPVDKGRGLSRKGRIWLAAAVALFLLLALLYPSIRRWAQSETSISISRVRLGTVSRGDLVRDVSVEGRIVAAFHPTLFSPAPGIVRLVVKTGEVVIAGQELAVVSACPCAGRSWKPTVDASACWRVTVEAPSLPVGCHPCSDSVASS